MKEELSSFCSSWAGLMWGVGLGWEHKEQFDCPEMILLTQSEINP